LDFNRFDVSTKELVWDDPVAWLLRLGIDPVGPVVVIDSDITTLSAAADKVIRVGGLVEPFLVNIELQAGHDSQLMRTLWYRQVALDYRHDLPVLTVLVLLRKEANSPSLTGVYERFLPDGRPTNRYDYQVVRLWKEPAESFLNAGVELVPLVPLSDVDEQQLPELIRKMGDRINPLPASRAAKLWIASYLLMGLRYPDELTERLFEGVKAVKESTTYQKILRDGRVEGRAEGRAEGHIEEAQQFLLLLGTERFGSPEAVVLAAIEEISDLDRLRELGKRILKAEVLDWEGLLGLA
jgi:predicted transposase YdaD